MDKELRDLFLSKGLTEDAIDGIEAEDDSLRSLDDLASAAVSEQDAREWAVELGLTQRVAKAKFVQSWIDARAKLQCQLRIASGETFREALVPPVVSPRAGGNLSESQPVPEVTHAATEQLPTSSAAAPSRPRERSAFQKFATAAEEASSWPPKGAAAVAAVALRASEEQPGIEDESDVEGEEVLKGPMDYPLFSLWMREDYDACADFLMEHARLESKEELKALLATMLGEASGAKQACQDGGSKVLPSLLSSYGLSASEVSHVTEVEEADWRWRWTLRSLFTPRTAMAVQRVLLQEYSSDAFQAAARTLGASWEERKRPPVLEQKMMEIEELCKAKVLSKVLPRFGFSPDADGAKEMKAVVAKHARLHPQVRQLQLDISNAVMAEFQL